MYDIPVGSNVSNIICERINVHLLALTLVKRNVVYINGFSWGLFGSRQMGDGPPQWVPLPLTWWHLLIKLGTFGWVSLEDSCGTFVRCWHFALNDSRELFQFTNRLHHSNFHIIQFLYCLKQFSNTGTLPKYVIFWNSEKYTFYNFCSFDCLSVPYYVKYMYLTMHKQTWKISKGSWYLPKRNSGHLNQRNSLFSVWKWLI